MLNFGLSMGRGDSLIPPPDWFSIIDEADIFGAWDFTWGGHASRESALRNLAGIMPDFTIEEGNPGWNLSEGMQFGGSGALEASLPELNIAELSTVMQFSNYTPKATLDAFFSHYITDSHYVLQNKNSENMIRWSCGDRDSDTLEITGAMLTEGVYGVSGPKLYANGALLGSVADPGTSISSGLGFRIGCVYVSGGPDQHLKAHIQKVLIVKRILSDDEQLQLYQRMIA